MIWAGELSTRYPFTLDTRLVEEQSFAFLVWRCVAWQFCRYMPKVAWKCIWILIWICYWEQRQSFFKNPNMDTARYTTH